jgi:F-type H+-transporting ATPase subunit gamma
MAARADCADLADIDELLETLDGTFHRLRQTGIDAESFDVVSGFEALPEARGDSERRRQ